MIRQPTPWRLTNIAFAIWAANFLAVYAAALVDDAGLIAKGLAVGIGVASVPLYLLIWRSAAHRAEARMVRMAVTVSALATLFNAMIVIA
jgi:hypothetical protein